MLQTSEFAISLGNVLQAITSASIVAGARVLWSLRGEVLEIKAVLNHPQLGVAPSIESLRKSRHNDSNTLQSHEARLDGHDKEFERIDATLIREAHGERRVNAETNEAYDRREKK